MSARFRFSRIAWSCAAAASALAGAQFTGKRNSDSSNFKEFELRMTKGRNS